MRRRITSVVGACALLMAITWLPGSAQATANPQVLPLGRSYGEWNARWWQWFFSVPASKNPGLAGNGAVDCRVGQSGDIWFLAGFFGSGSFSVTRDCSIPAGKTLVVPLINAWTDNVCNSPQLSVDQLRANAAGLVIPASNLHASVDGQQLGNLDSNRAISPMFGYTLPPSPDNVIFATFGVTLPGDCWPSLTVRPAVADGFYAVLAPLTAGVHHIEFGGSGPRGSQNITYQLSVT
jgi:hypothetical protein